MTNKDFIENILKPRLKDLKERLNLKGIEYSGDDNRFSNFEEISDLMSCPAEYVAFMFMMKHFKFIYDICLCRYPEEKITKELIDEKFGDCQAYLVLIEGIIKEKYELLEG